jgi:ketosteroid isomerase-like protein
LTSDISTSQETTVEKTFIWCLLGVISLGSVAWSQDKQPGGGTEKAVAALEQQWLQALKTNNPDLVAPLLADKFVNTSSSGKVTGKAETLRTIKTIRWDSAEYGDMEVTVFGDTAIATGEFKGNGADASAKPFDDHERWTDTWVKMPNGQWQCVATQGTPVRM